MNQKRTQNVVRGIGAGFINNILSILLPFISRTVIIYTLGVQYAGLNSLFGSILSILNITELGIGGAVSYSMYRPLQEGDDEKVCAILAFYRKCYRIIGVITLAAGLAILPFLDKLVAGEHPADINLYVLYLIYLANNVLGYFMFAYKRVILSANQRYDVEVSITSVCTILQSVLQIGLLLLVPNYYVYVIVIPVITLVGNVLSSMAASKMFPQFFCRGTIEREQIRDIAKRVGGILFTKIGSTVFLNVDNLVVSAFLGLTVLGVYGNYYYVVSCLIAIFAVIHNSLRPVIGSCLITDSKEKIYDEFETYQFMYVWFAGWAAICMVCLYQNFEFVWGGIDNLLPLEIAILLAVCFYIGRLGALQEVYLEAAGIYWERKYIPIIATVINLSLNIFLVQRIGLYGIILSTIVSYLLVTLPWDVYMVRKHCFKELLSLPKFYLKLVVQALVCLLSGVITFKVCSLLGETSILHLVERGIVCIVLPNLLYIICYGHGKNFKRTVELIKGLLKKKR